MERISKNIVALLLLGAICLGSASCAVDGVKEPEDTTIAEETEKETVGTDIIMTLKKDTEDDNFSRFLEEYEIRSLVKKYSDYIRYPIRMEISKSRKTADSHH